MRKILTRQRRSILNENENKEYDSYQAKNGMFKIANNVVFVYALFKFWNMRHAETHLRRLALLKILGLQAFILAGEFYT